MTKEEVYKIQEDWKRVKAQNFTVWGKEGTWSIVAIHLDGLTVIRNTSGDYRVVDFQTLTPKEG